MSIVSPAASKRLIMKMTTSGSVCPTAPPRFVHLIPLMSRLLCASPAPAPMQRHAPQTSVQ